MRSQSGRSLLVKAQGRAAHHPPATSPVLRVDSGPRAGLRAWGVRGRNAPLTVSHDDNDMSGAVPGLSELVYFPAHHVVHFQERPLGVSTCLQLVICEQGRCHHLA